MFLLKKKGKRIAFDICPVNIVLNFYTRKLGFEYDDKGILASKGRINLELLEELNSLGYYTKEGPKSLGLEWVQKEVLPLIDKHEENIENVLRTFVEHIAFQIASNLMNGTSILVTGGGVYNVFIINRIEFFLKKRVVIPSKELIDYKEALIFAFLGILRLKNEINCLQTVTGARKDHSSGVIFYP